MYDFNNFKQRIIEVEEWLRKEYKVLRTGRATPTLLDSIQVDNYGSRVPLNQVANISVEDARTLHISPWDSSQIKEIEKTITDANFGVGITTDGKSIRVSFPELTADRRIALIKMAKERLEDARKSLRGFREDTWNDIQAQEKNGDMSEDEKFNAKEELQKYVDEANTAMEEVYQKKEKEISE